MDDRKIHALLTTYRTGSFSKAAQELNCTQSAVTQMMNSLENELSCKLLARSHTGVRLTPAGEELLPLLLEAESVLTRLAKEARNLSEGEQATIRIGSFASISSSWLPQILQNYRAENPKVVFDLRVSTDQLPQWLGENRIDLALGDAYRCQGAQWYPLMEDPYYAVVPAHLLPPDQKVISQEAFARYPLIMSPMNALEHHMDVLSHQQLNVSSDDDSSILAMVAQGLGVTAMPWLSLGRLPDNLRVLELNPVPHRVLGVALPKSPTKAAASFAEFLKKQYPYPKK
ncbi:MAG: LysR family transcriptional regulator [Ruminiclostridium sp.]|nr:LysR family transcriptional regulator [Ruminiclostridium sp.]